MPKTKSVSGGARIKLAGRRPVLTGFEPDDHDKIRRAASIERRTMTQFLIHHTVQAATRVLQKDAKNSAK